MLATICPRQHCLLPNLAQHRWAAALRTIHISQVIERMVADATDVDWLDITGPHRGGSDVVFARHLAMYLAHVGAGLSLTACGFLFERDRRTVAHAVAAIEDRRDVDVALDAALDAMACGLALSLERFELPHSTTAAAARPVA